jgi:ribosome maturation factor RimP
MAKVLGPDFLIEKITAIVEPIITEMQLELVEVQFRREQFGQVLRLLIDSDSGITIDHCKNVSREVGHILEVEDVIDLAYHLEVSSPGLDRPLKTARDFKRCQGKKINVSFIPEELLEDVTGVIVDCVSDTLALEIDGKLLKIALEKIKKATQVIEF